MLYVDVRITEYSGLDPTNPVDVTSSSSGSTNSASSGSVTTTAANTLLFAAGMTWGFLRQRNQWIHDARDYATERRHRR